MTARKLWENNKKDEKKNEVRVTTAVLRGKQSKNLISLYKRLLILNFSPKNAKDRKERATFQEEKIIYIKIYFFFIKKKLVSPLTIRVKSVVLV